MIRKLLPEPRSTGRQLFQPAAVESIPGAPFRASRPLRPHLAPDESGAVAQSLPGKGSARTGCSSLALTSGGICANGGAAGPFLTQSSIDRQPLLPHYGPRVALEFPPGIRDKAFGQLGILQNADYILGQR